MCSSAGMVYKKHRLKQADQPHDKDPFLKAVRIALHGAKYLLVGPNTHNKKGQDSWQS